jgi:ABC-2 type transport system permease protein
MVWRIARCETLGVARDGRFVAVAVSLFLLLSAALWNGAAHYAEAHERQTLTARDEQTRWLNQGERNPHSAAHQGFWMFQPSTPLALFDEGIRKHVGSAVHLEAHSQRLFGYRPAEDSTWVQRMGELTAAVTLQRFIPLLIILAGFATLAGEREDGMIRFALSSGVSPRTLTLGKAIGLVLPLGLVLVPACLLGGFALALYGGPSAGALIPRALILSACYLAYFSIFVAITMSVSAHAATARKALVTLVFIWIGLVLVAPPLVLSAAAQRNPTPTALEFEGSLQQARARGPLYFERLVAVEDRLLAQHKVKGVDQLPVNSEGIAMIDEEASEDALHDVQFRGLHEAYRQQSRMFQLASVVSPLVAVQTLSMGLSGSDLAHHLHFAEAAEAYRKLFVQMMNRDLAQNDFANARRPSSPDRPDERVYLAGRELWERTPPFIYIPPSLDATMTQNRPGVAGLTLWLLAAAVAWTLAFRRFMRDLS